MDKVYSRNEAYRKDLEGRRASGDNNKRFGGRLESWRQQWLGKESIVWGRLYDDPNKRWIKGQVIHTSMIVDLDEKTGKLETMNTRYDLGVKAIEGEIEEARL